jgi:hypothetical protein|tara:strand:+ start:6940 stop:7212 length:273 start_codon:yes stop_codon:yes gene_type:complete
MEKKHEIKVVAKVKLNFNLGRLRVEPGDVLFLGDDDREAGINIENLLKNEGVVLYKSEKQVQEIKDWYKNVAGPARDEIKAEKTAKARRR